MASGGPPGDTIKNETSKNENGTSKPPLSPFVLRKGTPARNPMLKSEEEYAKDAALFRKLELQTGRSTCEEDTDEFKNIVHDNDLVKFYQKYTDSKYDCITEDKGIRKWV